ncbi:MAG: efflux RND transporter permease subunit [Bacteroidetes bacterium]|nr:efflux RND transporter permease subunit [Bacteroidota bacterium]
MTEVIAFFVRYKVWTNVLLFGILAFGLIFLMNIKFSFFPETRPDFLNVQVAYPGASPEEVEEGVVLKIEEAIDGLEGIERVTSVSRENFGNVTVEITSDDDMDDVLRDVKNAVDRINSFPLGSEKPVIFEQRFRSRALSIVLYGETDLYNLKYYGERLRDQLLATPDISQVAIEGVPRLEFSLEVSESNLRRFGLTFREVADAVASENINLSGGKVDTRDEEILIRANARAYYAKELANLVVRGNPDGTITTLKDIATIRERWEDVPDKSYYNGRTAAVLNIDKTREEDILAVANAAKALVAEFNDTHEQVRAEVLDDNTVSLRERLSLLINNGLIGLALVIIALGFFLNLRLSFWVSIGIPFSFAGMFIVAGFAGITINVISLFGMIVVVGILVDDAIVVGENIYAHYENGKSGLQAAIDGTKEMVGPVTTSVLTTIVAFLPFFFLEGFLGKFIWHMALVVIATLAFSLMEAFLILPAHLAHSKGLHPHAQDRPMRQRIDRFITWMTNDLYGTSLRFALRHKWITVVTPVAAVLITLGLLRGGLIGVTFFPFIDGDTMPVNLSLVAGRQEADTDSLLTRIERAGWALNDELKAERADNRDVVIGIKRDIGTNDFGESGSHTGRLTLLLLPGEERNMDTPVIANRLREMVGAIPEAQKLTFGRVGFFGKPVSISLLGNDLQQLTKARNRLVAELDNFPSLKDVTDSEQEGRREIDIRLKPRAYALGLTLRDIASQVRQGFFGLEVQRIQRGRDEIRVWVRYTEEDRSALGFIDQMRIRTPDGAEYPFSELAEYNIARGIITINRLENLREIKVEANLTDFEADLPPILDEIRNEVIPGVLAGVTGVRASFEGQSRNQEKTTRSMRTAFSVALLVMFILVILVFRSYAQALLVFSIIPLGVLGAIWGHGIHGIQLNTLSIYGLIALTGIIINDSIVFIDQINRNLRNGVPLYDAVYTAGLSRLRPILLTTITTAAGLGPLILETSRQAQFLIPMAISVAYGLVFGTFILLMVLPAAFLVANKLRVLWAQFILRRKGIRLEELEPAVKEILYLKQQQES